MLLLLRKKYAGEKKANEPRMHEGVFLTADDRRFTWIKFLYEDL